MSAMSGPRITSGEASKQDYKTPADFMAAVTKRFGAPTFDLAAHAGNRQCDRYYAPRKFDLKVDGGKDDFSETLSRLVTNGTELREAQEILRAKWPVGIAAKASFSVPNHDAFAVAFDAMRDDRGMPRRWVVDVDDGLGWLNCEFSDIAPWAEACAWNMQIDGVRSLLLTPATFSNWHTHHIAGVADVYELSGRLCFDGKNPFPKDCRLSHFHPGATGKVSIWDWRRDRILAEWFSVAAIEKLSGPQVVDALERIAILESQGKAGR